MTREEAEEQVIPCELECGSCGTIASVYDIECGECGEYMDFSFYVEAIELLLEDDED